jgi:nucleoside-diphosphate-sugar epimerase
MRAVVLGGTGAIGGAVSLRLAATGWDVDITGRNPAAIPQELSDAGVRFHQIERGDIGAIGALVGSGADLLVDVVAYRASDVRALLPVMSLIASQVLISTRAVYVDPEGRQINGDEAPHFAGPISEDSPTLPPAADGVDPFTREGYAPSKVAAERVALDSGMPVSVIRPSKIHGKWVRNARTLTFVDAMLRGDRVITLAGGESIDHLTAAENTAALIETLAHAPGPRIVNSADPDTPTAEEIVHVIAKRLGWEGQIRMLPSDSPADDGANPWRQAHPIVLDTSVSRQLGYRPVGTAKDLLPIEIDWVAQRVILD